MNELKESNRNEMKSLNPIMNRNQTHLPINSIDKEINLKQNIIFPKIIGIQQTEIVKYLHSRKYFQALTLALGILSRRFQIVPDLKIIYSSSTKSSNKIEEGLEGWFDFLRAFPIDSPNWNEENVTLLSLLINIINEMKLELDYKNVLQLNHNHSSNLINSSSDLNLNVPTLREWHSEENIILFKGINLLWSNAHTFPQNLYNCFFKLYLNQGSFDKCEKITEMVDSNQKINYIQHLEKAKEFKKTKQEKKSQSKTNSITKSSGILTHRLNTNQIESIHFDSSTNNYDINENSLVNNNIKNTNLNNENNHKQLKNENIKLILLEQFRKLRKLFKYILKITSKKKLELLLAIGTIIFLYYLFGFKTLGSLLSNIKEILKMYWKAMTVLY